MMRASLEKLRLLSYDLILIVRSSPLSFISEVLATFLGLRKLVTNRPASAVNNVDSHHALFAGERPGAFCISIDFELAWGKMYTPDHFVSRFFSSLARKNCIGLLRTLQAYSVPSTWATVGHLVLQKCSRDPQTGLAHPELERPAFHRNLHWSFLRGDWYQYDPCTSAQKNPAWYAPDIIDEIVRDSNQMELATHTFSHVPFDSCSEEVARGELATCSKVMNSIGVQPVSIVFPGNLAGHLDLLRQFGIIAYRGSSTNGQVANPTRTREGVWNVPSTLQIGGVENSHKVVSSVKTLIRRAIQSQCVCHIWLHPEELDPWTLKRVLRPILQYVKQCESQGELWLANMREIAAFCESKHV